MYNINCSRFIFQLTTGDEILNFIRCFLYQCCMFTQIFMLCYFANEVTLTSEKLSLAIYRAGWVDWNEKNRKLALQMMGRLDLPIRIKTINRCYSFNLAAFTSVSTLKVLQSLLYPRLIIWKFYRLLTLRTAILLYWKTLINYVNYNILISLAPTKLSTKQWNM